MSVDTTPDENQAYYDKIARETLSNTSRENAGLLTLAKLAREARERGDKTMLGDLSDEIIDKLSAAQEQYGWSKETLGQHHDFITNMIYGDESTGEQLEPSTTEPSGGKQPGQQKGKGNEGKKAPITRFDQVREAYVQMAAKMQKRHFTDIKESSRLVGYLAAKSKRFNKLIDIVTGNQELGYRARGYERQIKERLEALGTDEERRAAIVKLYTEDAKRIVELQKEDMPKAPVSKWFRRAVYALSGVAGGAVAVAGSAMAMGPLGAMLGGAGATAAAVLMRRWANKRNVHTMAWVEDPTDGKEKEMLVAEFKAKEFSEKIKKMANDKDGDGYIYPLLEKSDGKTVLSGEFADKLYSNVYKETEANRKRLLKGVLGALAFMAATGVAGNWLWQYMQEASAASSLTPEGTPQPTAGAEPSPTAEASASPTTEASPAPSGGTGAVGGEGSGSGAGAPATGDSENLAWTGQEFTVEAGHGYTHELQEFARANGVDLSSEQAYELHLRLVERFGENYLDIKDAVTDTYHMGDGGVGLAKPGAAVWKPGVAEAVRDFVRAA